MQDPDTLMDDCVLYMFKYYPNEGWYIPMPDKDKWVKGTEEWLQKHSHGSLLGQDITIIYDSMFGMGKERTEILKVIGEGLAKIQDGRGDEVQ